MSFALSAASSARSGMTNPTANKMARSRAVMAIRWRNGRGRSTEKVENGGFHNILRDASQRRVIADRNNTLEPRRTQKKRSPAPCFHRRRGVTLATSYFRTTYRGTIIGAAAFHFRVRNGNGWSHCAGITRSLEPLRRGLKLETSDDHRLVAGGPSGMCRSVI